MILSRIPRTLDDLDEPTFVRSSPPAWANAADAPFQIRRITLRPGEITVAHNHHDSEVWTILDGHGEVRFDDQTSDVRAGDTVYLSPLAMHTLRNTAGDRPLSFLSIWWVDVSKLAEVQAERAARSTAIRSTAAQSSRAQQPVVLIPSFPTPNGELHLGHLAGPYLTADACWRWLTASGVQAYLLLGTVGHQSQVAAAAATRGLSFYELAERNTDAIIQALTAAQVHWDLFVRPSAPRYPELVTEIFERLKATGRVIRRSEPANFCVPCSRFLFEAFIAGSCPHCGSSHTAGIECEVCAMPFADGDLMNPACAKCGTPAQQRDLARYFLPLEPLRKRLTDYLGTVSMNVRLRGYVERALAGPLPDLPVTIAADDGIAVQVEQDEPNLAHEWQRIYSAFELAARYLVALDELAIRRGAAGWQEYVAAEKPRTVLLFGFDNAFLRAFAFPAVLGAFTDAVALPDTMLCNEFYLLNGEKFSTSRENAIWGRTVFHEDTCDQLRLYLAVTSPDLRRRNFTVDGYATFVRTVLHDGWQHWLDGVGHRLAECFDGVVPEAGSWNAEAERFYGHIREMISAAGLAYRREQFSPRLAVEALCTFVARARYFTEVADDVLTVSPSSGTARTCMALELMAVRTLAMTVAPLAPNLAAGLSTALGEPNGIPVDDVPRWVRPGTPVTFETHYFSALDIGDSQ